MCLSLASPPNRILARFDVRTTVFKKFNPAGWPLAAHAQQGERVRRIGVVMSTAAAEGRAHL